ncbi:CPBP family intramembrane glutamic endopeptidase [Saccharopolyspora gregorii]|uniref:CAAX prenyl protease 2/Lysostaphin resistance protein A-like domain-containing protein n=1 Tax=Saccharopolyspora gregorii TaxID=33914 RepID=A0ABP6RQU3_9PSEU
MVPTTQDTRTPRPGGGIPYHLLQRGSRHRWWRTLLGFPLLGLLALVCMGLVTGAVFGLAALAGVEQHDGTFADPVWEYTAGFLVVAALLPAVLLTARWAHGRPAGTLSSVDGRLRLRWLAHCTGWALGGFALVTAFGLTRGEPWLAAQWPGFARYALLALITLAVVPLQAAAEEYLCRGFLLQSFASWWRTPWPSAVLTSVLFVALHGYDDPLVLADMFVFALAMSWLTVRTGGLEAAIALHVVNNAFGMLVACTQGVPSLEQSGDFAAWDVLPTTALTVVYAWWIDRLARRRGIARAA